MNLAQTIRTTRKNLGLTVEDAARSAGISRSYWEKIEAGSMKNPGVEKLGKIADALHVTPAELITGQFIANKP